MARCLRRKTYGRSEGPRLMFPLTMGTGRWVRLRWWLVAVVAVVVMLIMAEPGLDWSDSFSSSLLRVACRPSPPDSLPLLVSTPLSSEFADFLALLRSSSDRNSLTSRLSVRPEIKITDNPQTYQYKDKY